jgi:hypothetical protein
VEYSPDGRYLFSSGERLDFSCYINAVARQGWVEQLLPMAIRTPLLGTRNHTRQNGLRRPDPALTCFGAGAGARRQARLSCSASVIYWNHRYRTSP